MTFYSYRYLTMCIAMCGGMSMAQAACVSSSTVGSMPESGVYAPAELVEPYMPQADLVKPLVVEWMGLDELLVFADTHSPVIQAARSRVGLTDAGVVEADIVLPANPKVELGLGRRTVEGKSGFDFEVAIAQQFEVAGERGLRIEAAQRKRHVALARVGEVRWAIHVEVHRLVFALLLASESREQAERFVTFSEGLERVAQQKVEAGQSSPLILLVAQADTAQTREAFIEATQYEAALKVRLAALIGWPAALSMPSVQGTLPPVQKAPAPEVLLARMSKHHPALRTRELALSAHKAHWRLEEREAWPEPTLGVGFSREAAPGAEPEAGVWLLSLGIPIPLWRTNQAGVAHARAEVRIADREREAAAMQLRSEVLQAAIALDASAQRVRLYASSIVPKLEENLARLKRAFELGEIDVHQVSQTRSRLLEATHHYLGARIDYYETGARLEGLSGTELWPPVVEKEGAP